MRALWLGPVERPGSLARHVFLANAAVVVVATLVLILTPVTISFPLLLTEAVIVLVGLAVMLAIDLWLVQRAFAPLARLTEEVRGIDPHRPRRRLDVDGHGEVVELVEAFNRMLERLDDERRERGRQAVAAQEGERERVARELHDEVGQQLTAVLLQLGWLHGLVPEPLRGSLEEAQESARASLDDVRRVAQRLRPGALDDLGLTRALAGLCTTMQAGNRFRVQRRLAPELPELDPEVELVVYRVAQESLTNAARHSDAGEVTVELAASEEAVRLTVRDDGRGLNGATWGSGFRGMRERAELIGADLEVASRPAAGTTISITVPLEPRR